MGQFWLKYKHGMNDWKESINFAGTLSQPESCMRQSYSGLVFSFLGAFELSFLFPASVSSVAITPREQRQEHLRYTVVDPYSASEDG